MNRMQHGLHQQMTCLDCQALNNSATVHDTDSTYPKYVISGFSDRHRQDLFTPFVNIVLYTDHKGSKS